jgi:chondroitin AC lyase
MEALLRYQRLAGQAQSDTILARYKRYLLNAAPPADKQRADVGTPDNHSDPLHQWMSSLGPSGQWPDIDYTDTRKAGWRLLEHLGRVESMAIAWSDPRSRYYRDTMLWNVMNRALDHWLKMKYHNSNWWNNEIGVPRLMRDLLVLLHDHMDPSRLEAALQVLGQYRLQKSGAGANLIWSADLGLHFGALAGNIALIKQCAALVADEVRITTEDGIQPDYSFHQHKARLQMYQYGAAYLQSTIRLAWELKATPWAFPEEKIRLLADFVLDGWQWMARGINTVPGTMDRSASRMNALHDADLRAWIPYLCILYPPAAKEFSAIADRQNDNWQNGNRQNGNGQNSNGQNGKETALAGFRYFPYSDFSVYQEPQFSFFLKTISDRTLASESINSENLKGRLLNSGDAYIIRNGNEYFNLMPVWDWNKLPGVTSFDGATKIDRQSFTGSVSDGKSGMTVMDYRMEGDSGQSLTARKYWACHDGLVVCLIAGLQTRGLRGDAFTTLDQCRWQGDVTVGRSGNVDPGSSGPTAEVLEAGEHTIDSVKWIHHAGLATIFLRPAHVSLHIGAVTGNWASINASEPATPLTEKIFLPVLIHPSGAVLPPSGDKSGVVSTGYVLASRATAEQAKSLANLPAWKIIRNDSDCQAVQFDDGVVMCSFYSKGSLTLSNGKTIAADRPCLMLVTGDQIYLSDPSRKGGTAVIRVNKKEWNIPLPDDGTTVGRR